MKKVQGKHKIQESWQFHKQQKWQAEVIPMVWKAKQSSEDTTRSSSISNTGLSTQNAETISN